MYPRRTLVDPPHQYDPSIPAGSTGGTMHLMFRGVKQEDIYHLKLHKLNFENNKALLGNFTNSCHWNHEDIPPEEFMKPPVYGWRK